MFRVWRFRVYELLSRIGLARDRCKGGRRGPFDRLVSP